MADPSATLDKSRIRAFCMWCLFEYFYRISYFAIPGWGWSGGATVLGKLPVPARPFYLE